MLSELRFATFLSYSPRGDTDFERRSRDITYALKQDAARGNTGRTTSQELARRIRELFPGSALEGYLQPEAVLVPMPRSGVLRRGVLWPARRIADAMCAEGFGAQVAPVLVRTRGVRRSATTSGSLRLWPDEHYDSLEVRPTLHESPALILLVDDVITRGSMFLGAASRLAEAFPEAELRAFAVVRTIKPYEALERLTDPRVGLIQWTRGASWISRDP